MERVHEESKPAEKAEGPSIRREAAPSSPPGTRAVLDLQRAAGNQAVARMLAASGHRRPRRGLEPPISVQRNELDNAILKVKQGENVDFKEFAEKLIAKMEEPGTSSKEGGAGQKTTAGKGTKTGPAAPLVLPGIATAEELEARQKKLKERETQLQTWKRMRTGRLSDEERRSQAASKKLDEREGRLAAEEQLAAKYQELEEGQKEVNERIANLRQRLTKPEIELRNKKEELDVLEKQRKDEEELQETARKRAIQARLLNPRGKSLGKLAKGRMF